jgi:hypothetical protein
MSTSVSSCLPFLICFFWGLGASLSSSGTANLSIGGVWELVVKVQGCCALLAQYWWHHYTTACDRLISNATYQLLLNFSVSNSSVGCLIHLRRFSRLIWLQQLRSLHQSHPAYCWSRFPSLPQLPQAGFNSLTSLTSSPSWFWYN